MKREIIIEREQIREVNLDRKKEQFRELCGTEDSVRELFKLLYIDKIATKEELKNLFTVRNISFDMAYDILIEEGYIEEVSFIKEKGSTTIMGKSEKWNPRFFHRTMRNRRLKNDRINL